MGGSWAGLSPQSTCGSIEDLHRLIMLPLLLHPFLCLTETITAADLAKSQREAAAAPPSAAAAAEGQKRAQAAALALAGGPEGLMGQDGDDVEMVSATPAGSEPGGMGGRPIRPVEGETQSS